jgi:hypothetical protein
MSLSHAIQDNMSFVRTANCDDIAGYSLASGERNVYLRKPTDDKSS